MSKAMPHNRLFSGLENIIPNLNLMTFETWFIVTVLLSRTLSKEDLLSQWKHVKSLGYECVQAGWPDAAQQLFSPLYVLSFVMVVDYIACFLFTVLWSVLGKGQ